eukprot:Sspe_Gene.9459::Locus_3174_Transcript_1_1_Confidence_1.000_Length_2223::g.9459::m.9459
MEELQQFQHIARIHDGYVEEEVVELRKDLPTYSRDVLVDRLGGPNAVKMLRSCSEYYEESTMLFDEDHLEKESVANLVRALESLSKGMITHVLYGKIFDVDFVYPGVLVNLARQHNLVWDALAQRGVSAAKYMGRYLDDLGFNGPLPVARAAGHLDPSRLPVFLGNQTGSHMVVEASLSSLPYIGSTQGLALVQVERDDESAGTVLLVTGAVRHPASKMVLVEVEYLTTQKKTLQSDNFAQDVLKCVLSHVDNVNDPYYLRLQGLTKQEHERLTEELETNKANLSLAYLALQRGARKLRITNEGYMAWMHPVQYSYLAFPDKDTTPVLYTPPPEASAAEVKNQGNTLFGEGKWTEAIHAWHSAVKLDAAERSLAPSLFANIAQAYIKLGNFERALGAAEAGLVLNPSDKLKEKLKWRRDKARDELTRGRGEENACTWARGLSPVEQAEWFVDCYRMRVDDEYVYRGDHRPLYCGPEPVILELVGDFLSFAKLAVRNKAVPSGWDWAMCLRVAKDLLPYAFEKSDAQEKYGTENVFHAVLNQVGLDSASGRSLRYTAEVITGSSVNGDIAGLENEMLDHVYESLDGEWNPPPSLVSDVGGVQPWTDLYNALTTHYARGKEGQGKAKKKKKRK